MTVSVRCSHAPLAFLPVCGPMRPARRRAAARSPGGPTTFCSPHHPCQRAAGAAGLWQRVNPGPRGPGGSARLERIEVPLFHCLFFLVTIALFLSMPPAQPVPVHRACPPAGCPAPVGMASHEALVPVSASADRNTARIRPQRPLRPDRSDLLRSDARAWRMARGMLRQAGPGRQ